MSRPRRMTKATCDALHADLGLIPNRVAELSRLHGVAVGTVAKHIILLATGERP